MDLSKRANLRNVREVRLAGPSASPEAQWRIDKDAVEFRDNDSDFYTFRGEASVVGHTYKVSDSYGEFEETIRAGAFDKTLSEDPMVSFVYMHDMATVMASTRGGGLALSTNPHLLTEARLPKNDLDVQRFAPKAQRGDANAMSFAFRVTGQNWNADYTEREITEVNLSRGDVSALPTGLGCNPVAWGSLRASDDIDEAYRAIREERASSAQVAAVIGLLTGVLDPADYSSAAKVLDALNAGLAADIGDVTTSPTGRSADLLPTAFAKAKRSLPAGTTYGDLQAILDSAVKESFGSSAHYSWVRDFNDEWVVYYIESDADTGPFQVNYSIDESGSVVFSGDPVPVVQHTSYEPARSILEPVDPNEAAAFVARMIRVRERALAL